MSRSLKHNNVLGILALTAAAGVSVQPRPSRVPVHHASSDLQGHPAPFGLLWENQGVQVGGVIPPAPPGLLLTPPYLMLHANVADLLPVSQAAAETHFLL